MNIDCLIIGGGLSGLTCGIKCAGEGLRTVIISDGVSSLHVSSGSVDMLGYISGRVVKGNVFKSIKEFVKKNPLHPYNKTGIGTLKESVSFIRDEVKNQGLILNSNGDGNHIRFTALGVMKPTYLSQNTVFNRRLKQAIERRAPIAVLNFHGFRDYYPQLAANMLMNNRILKGAKILYRNIDLPRSINSKRNTLEFRSIDLAGIFETEKYLPGIAGQIKKNSGNAEIVVLPDFLGINNFNYIHKRLEELTGKLIVEVPNLPPSILGMRLEKALKSRFAELGGEFITGDRVIKGKISKGNVEYIVTENYPEFKYRAKYYLLSTGSFFSGGLVSRFNHLNEPIFNFKFKGSAKRNKWYSRSFFDKKSHPFIEFGVETNKSLNPLDENSRPVKNIFCSGAILSGYNPVKEGSGGGVALSTAYAAALKIIKKIKQK